MFHFFSISEVPRTIFVAVVRALGAHPNCFLRHGTRHLRPPQLPAELRKHCSVLAHPVLPPPLLGSGLMALGVGLKSTLLGFVKDTAETPEDPPCTDSIRLHLSSPTSSPTGPTHRGRASLPSEVCCRHYLLREVLCPVPFLCSRVIRYIKIHLTLKVDSIF